MALGRVDAAWPSVFARAAARAWCASAAAAAAATEATPAPPPPRRCLRRLWAEAQAQPRPTGSCKESLPQVPSRRRPYQRAAAAARPAPGSTRCPGRAGTRGPFGRVLLGLSPSLRASGGPGPAGVSRPALRRRAAGCPAHDGPLAASEPRPSRTSRSLGFTPCDARPSPSPTSSWSCGPRPGPGGPNSLRAQMPWRIRLKVRVL